MRKPVVLLIIILSLVAAYFISIYFQKLIQPKKSFGRLLLYFAATVALVFGLTWLMVSVIGWLYPQEIMK